MADLPILVEHFVKVFSRELAKPIHRVPPEFLDMLTRHDWPGNVRELQSAIKFAFVQATGDVLSPHWLPDHVTGVRGRQGQEVGTTSGDVHVAELARTLIRSGSEDVYRLVHAEVDRILLDVVLRHVDGNQVLASQILGMSRTTLRSRLSTLDSSK